MISPWQPIETAPRDGTRIRLITETEVVWREGVPMALVQGGWHRVAEADKVVGWLPAPPVEPKP